MANETVNALLAMSKSLRQRQTQLNELKNKCATITMWGEKDKTEEPVYDVKDVDKKIVKINNALFKIDTAIKASNAMTKVDVDVDYDDLTSSLD